MTTPATPAPPAHTRITFSGTFGTSQAVEEWAFNVNTRPIANQTAESHKALADACRTACTTLFSFIMTNDVALTRVRAAAVGGDGHVSKAADGSYVQGDNLVAYTSSSAGGTTYYPLQTALALSLDSARAGATGKGRLFLPFPRFYNLGSDYRLSVANRDAILGHCKTFINAISSAAGTPVVVASGKAGVLSNVMTVRMGLAPDTMRSRRGRLVENHARLTL